MSARQVASVLCLGLACLAMLLGGCGKKIVISQYPQFWDPQAPISSIAVWPFRNQTECPGAGDIASDKLAAALTANGTYTAYNAADLGAVEGARDLKLLAGDIEAATSAGRQFGKADAVITGTVTTYNGTTRQETRYNAIPIYRTDAKGMMYVAGYNNVPYPFTRHDAVVEATVSLVRLSDGRVIHSAHSVGSAWSEGQNPQWDINGCLVAASNTMVGDLIEELAIVRKEIKLDGDALRLAADLYDNKWDLIKSVPATTQKMLVVLSLPQQCDRNRFRIVIVRKDQREELAAHDLEWDDAFGSNGHGFAFDPSQIASKGGGPGKYTVKFYAGPEPALSRDFTIR